MSEPFDARSASRSWPGSDVARHDLPGDVAIGGPREVMPCAAHLAALGTVLCLYRERHGSELAGWSSAVSARSCAEVDSEGVREAIVFHDDHGHCCWRLFLLPDSNFLAWERMASSLPIFVPGPPEADLEALLLERVIQRSCGEAWRASVVRLHAITWETGSVLAISRAKPSVLATQAGLRIARSEFAHADAFDADCCCQSAAMVATHPDDGPDRILKITAVAR